MQSSSEQPLVGEERYVTTRITAAKETRFLMPDSVSRFWILDPGFQILDSGFRVPDFKQTPVFVPPNFCISIVFIFSWDL